ncbi:unnamed protein product [Chironomus riparius]|uniref:Uncharacterized protein n=1 Tax=Chironomus riparius TaxID=315576 RepID=A0A9N9RID7_9DIPT|nr:unnamed protein product [Chironomus riparius]
MRKFSVLTLALIMANYSYCQLGNSYGSKLGNKFGNTKYNGANAYTGTNTYSNNGYGSSYNNDVPTVSIPKGVGYTLSRANSFNGNQAKTVITEEIIETPTGTITKVTTTQQEPSGYANSVVLGQYGQQTRSKTTTYNTGNGLGPQQSVQQTTVQKVGPYGQQTVQRETVVSQQPSYGYGK